MNPPKSKFFIETDMFSELSTKMSDVPEIKKHIKYNKADVYTDISQDELIDIMCDSSEPTDAEGKRRAFIRDFYAIMQTESGPKPAKEFYTKVEEDPLYYYKKEPNSIFFTTKSKADRERIMNRYGVWMIGSEDLNDTLLDPYNDDYKPGKVFGEEEDGWASIKKRIGVFPSSCMVVLDNFITAIDQNTNEYYGLDNLRSIIYSFVPLQQKIEQYSVLIVTQQPYVSPGFREMLLKWIKDIKADFPKIKIQFIVSKNTPEHDRWIFFNYGNFESGKGFKIFEPQSNKVYFEGNKPYHFSASKYISQCSLTGTSPLERAHNIIHYVQKLYKRRGYDTHIIGDENLDISILR